MKKRLLVDKKTVKLRILLSIALQNLTSKKLRTGLTVFGISVGIGAIYFLLSFGVGLQELVTNQVIGNQSIKTIDVSSPNSKIVKLDDITTERIRNSTNVDSIGKAYFYPGSLKVSSSESDAIVYGIDKGFESLTYLNVIAGKLPSNSSESHPVVLNVASLEAIGLADNPKAMLGKTVTLIIPLGRVDSKIGTYTEDFTVAGIIDSGSGAEVFIPSSIFHDLGVPALTQLKVGVTSTEAIQTVRTQIESFGFETSSPVDTLNEIDTIFHYFNVILVGFGAIGMFIAVIGMLNTLTISLLERTKEIGLMVALGARSIDMRFLFMLEAMLLSIFGTIVGLIGATLLGMLVNLVMNLFARSRGVQDGFTLFAYPWWLTLGSVAFMVAVGFAVVYLPARRAEKINPIDALRHE